MGIIHGRHALPRNRARGLRSPCGVPEMPRLARDLQSLQQHHPPGPDDAGASREVQGLSWGNSPRELNSTPPLLRAVRASTPVGEAMQSNEQRRTNEEQQASGVEELDVLAIR